MKVEIEKNPARRSLDIWIYQPTPTGILCASPVELDFVERSVTAEAQPFISLSDHGGTDIAKELFLALKKVYEPGTEKVTVGEVERLTNHLEDMRSLVFKIPPK